MSTSLPKNCPTVGLRALTPPLPHHHSNRAFLMLTHQPQFTKETMDCRFHSYPTPPTLTQDFLGAVTLTPVYQRTGTLWLSQLPHLSAPPTLTQSFLGKLHTLPGEAHLHQLADNGRGRRQRWCLHLLLPGRRGPSDGAWHVKQPLQPRRGWVGEGHRWGWGLLDVLLIVGARVNGGLVGRRVQLRLQVLAHFYGGHLKRKVMGADWGQQLPFTTLGEAVATH